MESRLLRSPITPAPLGPVCPPRKKNNLYLFKSQTQPGNQIIYAGYPLVPLKKKKISAMMRLVPGNWLGVFVWVHFWSGHYFVRPRYCCESALMREKGNKHLVDGYVCQGNKFTADLKSSAGLRQLPPTHFCVLYRHWLICTWKFCLCVFVWASVTILRHYRRQTDFRTAVLGGKNAARRGSSFYFGFPAIHFYYVSYSRAQYINMINLPLPNNAAGL